MIKVARIQSWIGKQGPFVFSVYAIFFAFMTYFSMYAFRKPFSAATFKDQSPVVLPWLGSLVEAVDYKIMLIIAQVIGYMLSKFSGIKFISEVTGKGRATFILALILFAQLSLLGFALTPAPYNIPFLFLNGIPLGMVWGLVFGFLEGRRMSEALGAGLSASYIVASGFVKTVGRMLLDAGISAFWMPFLTGLLFLPILIICVFFLDQLPPPNKEDIALRTERRPMNGQERLRFLKLYFPGLFLLTFLYMFLTAYRDFRDNFAVEIYQGLGISDPAVFTYPEALISLLVLLLLGFLMRIRDNEVALITIMILMAVGSALIGLGTLAFQAGMLGPVYWMILVGSGLYVGYVPFGCMLFDRMIAAIGFVGTAGFMIYVTDSFGYLGSVFLLLYKNFGGHELSWLSFFQTFSYTTAVVGTLCFVLAAIYFHFAIVRKNRAMRASVKGPDLA